MDTYSLFHSPPITTEKKRIGERELKTSGRVTFGNFHFHFFQLLVLACAVTPGLKHYCAGVGKYFDNMKTHFPSVAQVREV